jgi:hypothetical protein
MRNDGSKKGSVEESRERRVGCFAFGIEVSCECPDGYRTFIRFRDQSLVQQGRVFADKSGGPRNWIVFSRKKQMVLIKWFLCT